jgi:hypothetical protein
MSGGGTKGNKNSVKLKDPEVRQEAFRQYCAYIASGNSKEAFVFDHPTLTCTWKTLEKYIAADPVEFPPIHKERAEAKSFEHWCTLGKQMMLGQIEKCQPAIFQMFMRNKFGWDKEEKSEGGKCAAETILDIIMDRKPK